MSINIETSSQLAVRITKAASKQSYYTIRLLADRESALDACRAYAYFRWVDDVVDAPGCSHAAASAFITRQERILDACARGEQPADLSPEEWMLADMLRGEPTPDSGLMLYLRNMLWVMDFDAGRRGQVISEDALAEYSHRLAVATTEALYHFIGRAQPTPPHEARYLAVTAAHIVHMLRDALDDTQSGYYNIPAGFLAKNKITARDTRSPAYRKWVCSRIQLARRYFKAGRQATARVKSLRCRLAGFAYVARFEWMLKTIERDRYCLREDYPERKSLWAALQMAWSTLVSALTSSPAFLTEKTVRTKK